MLTRWFPAADPADGWAGIARIRRLVHEAAHGEDRVDEETSPYRWTASGEQIIRAAAGIA